MAKRKFSQEIKAVPREPGVYLFSDEAGRVLYVGKAVCLRSRLRQYFSGREEIARGARIAELMKKTASFRVRPCRSALEALVLEAELIRRYQPRYNVLAKDDKSFSYFLITAEEFPRVLIVRESDLRKNKFRAPAFARGRLFGPYASRKQMSAALGILRKIFPFHDREGETEKGCLPRQIGLCPGPFDGGIGREDYRRNIRAIRMILSGRRADVLRDLEREMKEAARQERFEEAARCRDRLAALRHIRETALLTDDFQEDFGEGESGRVECFDVSHLGGEETVAAMVVFRNGRQVPELSRRFVLRSGGGDDLRAGAEVLRRRLSHLSDWGRPEVIVLDGGRTHLAMAEEVWKESGQDIALLALAKGPSRKKLDIYPSLRYPPPAELLRDKALLEALRTRAHRAAVAFHRRRRSANFLPEK